MYKNKTKNQRFLVCPRHGKSDKRGSHVGIVLSFVIFVTFLAFLYTIVEPEIRVQQDRESFLDYLKIELMQEFSANLTSVTVSINRTWAEECIILKDFTEEANVDSHLIVKDELGNIAKTNISDVNLIINRENIEKVFFKIYNSEEFSELSEKSATLFDCTILEKDAEWRGYPTGYSIPLTITEEYAFEKKVIELIKEYESEGGYENLRKKFKIPSGTEFGFSFTYSNKTIIETKEKGIPTKVQVREIPVQYIDREANVLLGSVNIKIW
jgi:hypothetical protein